MRARTKEIPKMNQKEIERFLSLVNKESDGECWVWKNTLDAGGYGNFKIRGISYKAHRVSYFHYNGSISTELVIDHLCKNRGCINPIHLRQTNFFVNNILNSDSPVATNKFKTHCVNGHEFSEENTLNRRCGSRIRRTCRSCHRIYGRKTDKKRRNRKK